MRQDDGQTIPREVRIAARLEKYEPEDLIGSRFYKRILRIMGGAALLFFIAVPLFEWAGEFLSKPFAVLTPLELLEGLAVGLCGFGVAAVAYFVAFGRGKSVAQIKQENFIRHRTYLERNLDKIEKEENRISQRAELRAQRAYSAGAALGKLFKKLKKKGDS